MSNMRGKEKMNESSSSATFKKDSSNVSKRAYSHDYCESFSKRDVGCSSDHARPSESISFIQIGDYFPTSLVFLLLLV